jgi:hypothetical protein
MILFLYPFRFRKNPIYVALKQNNIAVVQSTFGTVHCLLVITACVGRHSGITKCQSKLSLVHKCQQRQPFRLQTLRLTPYWNSQFVKHQYFRTDDKQKSWNLSLLSCTPYWNYSLGRQMVAMVSVKTHPSTRSWGRSKLCQWTPVLKNNVT